MVKKNRQILINTKYLKKKNLEKHLQMKNSYQK